jgi:fatty-acyl-CoA synthase
VAAVCVFAVPSDAWGQEVAAALVLRAGQSTADLRAHAEQRLAAFKRPRRGLLVDQLPTTASGKVSRMRASQLFGERCVSWSELDL